MIYMTDAKMKTWCTKISKVMKRFDVQGTLELR